MQPNIIEDGGTTVDFWIIKVHTSNYLLFKTEKNSIQIWYTYRNSVHTIWSQAWRFQWRQSGWCPCEPGRCGIDKMYCQTYRGMSICIMIHTICILHIYCHPPNIRPNFVMYPDTCMIPYQTNHTLLFETICFFYGWDRVAGWAMIQLGEYILVWGVLN